MQPSQETLRFIRQHLADDVRRLALRGGDEGVDMPFALDQIAGWQTARRKLPSWAATDGIVFPPHLNMEQCSSEQTARYKASLCATWGGDSCLVDLTGGLGVDFSFMAPRFRRAIYVEQDPRLCSLARHNLPLLHLASAEVVSGTAADFLDRLPALRPLTVFIDPARRDANGRRAYGIADCSPNILQMWGKLRAAASHIMVKLSPMLDWHEAVRQLDGAGEVHVVSVGNECKELLLADGEPKIVCVNDDSRFACAATARGPQRLAATPEAHYLYAPNASVMKAGCFAQLTEAFDVAAVDDNSHLFLSNRLIAGFPGRAYAITASTTMNKRELRQAFRGITRADITTRNFPLTAAQLGRRLHVAAGGDTRVFATTMHGDHRLFICRNATTMPQHH